MIAFSYKTGFEKFIARMSSTSIQKLLANFLLFAVNILLLTGHHRGEAASSSVRLGIRLISYENPANLRISGASCDSMSSPCDPAFDVIAVWGGEDIRVASPCLSNADRVDFPDELSRLPVLSKAVKSRDGPMPRWAEVRISIKDCLYNRPTDLIADLELNVTTASVGVVTEVALETNSSLIDNRSVESSSEGQLAVLQTSMGDSAAVLEMKRIRGSPESISMKISVWVECSPSYYGKSCNIRCEPKGSCCCDSEGRLRCDGTIDCSAQRAASTGWPATTPRAGPNNGGNNNAGDRNKDDEATSVMFIAVMASSMTSISILAIIALVAIKMCRASESNALIISRLMSQDASSSIDTESGVLHLRRQQNHYQLQQHQNLGYFNPSSYNTLTSQLTNLSSIVPVSNNTNRTDSGVYEDPQEPPTDGTQPPPPPPRQLPPRPNEEVQRMPQSKSYSRKAAKE